MPRRFSRGDLQSIQAGAAGLAGGGDDRQHAELLLRVVKAAVRSMGGVHALKVGAL